MSIRREHDLLMSIGRECNIGRWNKRPYPGSFVVPDCEMSGIRVKRLSRRRCEETKAVRNICGTCGCQVLKLISRRPLFCTLWSTSMHKPAHPTIYVRYINENLPHGQLASYRTTQANGGGGPNIRLNSTGCQRCHTIFFKSNLTFFFTAGER